MTLLTCFAVWLGLVLALILAIIFLARQLYKTTHPKFWDEYELIIVSTTYKIRQNKKDGHIIACKYHGSYRTCPWTPLERFPKVVRNKISEYIQNIER